jgi:hypothetical protein
VACDQTKPTDLTTFAKKNNGVFPLSAVYEAVDGRNASETLQCKVEAHFLLRIRGRRSIGGSDEPLIGTAKGAPGHTNGRGGSARAVKAEIRRAQAEVQQHQEHRARTTIPPRLYRLQRSRFGARRRAPDCENG